MGEKRTLKPEYEAIGLKLMKTEPALFDIAESGARFAFLESDSPKKTRDKIILGECEKVPSKNQWAIDADFLIILYTPNIIGLDEKQIEILIFHELLHAGVEYGEDGATYYIRDHDLEDFKIIIDRYGTEWNIPEEEK